MRLQQEEYKILTRCITKKWEGYWLKRWGGYREWYYFEWISMFLRIILSWEFEPFWADGFGIQFPRNISRHSSVTSANISDKRKWYYWNVFSNYSLAWDGGNVMSENGDRKTLLARALSTEPGCISIIVLLGQRVDKRFNDFSLLYFYYSYVKAENRYAQNDTIQQWINTYTIKR